MPIYVSSGQTRTSAQITSDVMYISSGGSALYTSIRSGGVVNVSSGGGASMTYVYSAGKLFVRSGGNVGVVYVSSGGSVYISSGGIVYSAYLYSGVTVDVSQGAMLSAAYLSSGASVDVSGYAFNAVLDNGATLWGSSGAYIYRPTVSRGGNMLIRSGCEAAYIVEDGGMVVIEPNASATFSQHVFSADIYSGQWATVHSGTTAAKVFLNSSGQMDVLGGYASKTTVRGGWLHVTSNGGAVATVLESGGKLTVDHGWVSSARMDGPASMFISFGSAADVRMESGCSLNVGLSAFVSSANAFNAKIGIISGGSMSVVNLNGGSMSVGSGGRLERASVSGFSGMEVGGATIGETINSAYLTINGGATVYFANVDSRAYMVVSSAAFGSCVSVYVGGSLLVRSGGSAVITENGGMVVLEPGAVATFGEHVFSDAILNSGDWATLHSGTTAASAVLYSSAQMDVLGGRAMGTVINSQGWLHVSSGGRADTTTITAFGSMSIALGGVANYTYVRGGDIWVNGGTATSTTAYSGGIIHAISAARLNDVTIQSGGRFIAYDCFVSNLNIYSSGSARFSSDAIISRAFVNNGGRLSIDGGIANGLSIYSSAQVNVSNGVVNYVIVNEGAKIYVESSGIAIDTILYDGDSFNDGGMYVFRGGVASNTYVGENAWLAVSSGGEVHGILNIASSNYSEEAGDDGPIQRDYSRYGNVSFTSGAKVVFDLENHMPADTPLINNWALITGGSNAVYCVTVSADQDYGTYILADKASGFNNSISVTIDNVGLGDMSIGSAFRYNGKFYSLAKTAAGELQFIVDLPEIIYVSNGRTSSGLTLTDKDMHVLSGGSAVDTAIDGTDIKQVVFDGGVALRTVVINGSMLVSGGLAEDTHVCENAKMVVSMGGSADSTNVRGNRDTAEMTTQDALMIISSGGTAGNTSVDGLALLVVDEGGVASNTTVNDANMRVSSGGTAIETNLLENSFGICGMTVYAGGVASNTSVGVGSYLTVSTQGELRGTLSIGSAHQAATPIAQEHDDFGNVLFNSGARFVFEMENRTVADAALINDWGRISGGTRASYYLTASADQEYGAYALADNASGFNSSIYVTIDNVEAGYMSDDTCIHYGGKIYSLAKTAGGNLQLVIETGEPIYVSSGHTSSGLVLTTRDMYVLSGGVAVNTTVNMGTLQNILPGGFANRTTVSNALMYVSGSANNTTINDQGQMEVVSGAVVNITSLGFCARMNVLESAVANGVTIFDQGGILDVYGSANDVDVSYCGMMEVIDGGVVDHVSASEGGMVSVQGGIVNSAFLGYNANLYLSSAGIVNDTTVNAGFMYVSNGGAANRTTVSNYGNMFVEDGGVANNTNVLGNGYICVSSGGVANNTEVLYTGDLAQYTSGTMDVLSGGVANNTTVMNGNLTVSSGGEVRGKLNIVTVYDDGEMAVPYAVNSYVRFADGARVVFDLEGRTPADTPLINNWGRISGGTAADYYLTASADQECGTYILADNAYGFNEPVFVTVGDADLGDMSDGLTVRCNDRAYTLVSNAQLLFVVDSAETIYVSSGHTSSGIALYYRDMVVLSGGVASNTTVYENTEQTVSTGGVANDTVVSEGRLTVSGGTTNDASIEFYGSMNVTNGGVANNTSLGMCATLNIEDSAVANGVFTEDQGAQINVSGGTVNDAYVDWYGAMSIYKDGLVNSASVFDGSISVFSKGVVNHAHVNNQGCLDVYSGGVANDVTVELGDMDVYYSGTANNTSLLSGNLYVSSGVVNSTAIYGDGSLIVSMGGVANDTEVLYTGDLSRYISGNMIVLSGGVANNTTVMNGNLTVSSGGEVRGKLNIVTVYDDGEMAVPYAVNSYVRFEPGARVVFDLEGRTPADTPLINNWGRISGGTAAYYFLTASADQECGDYILAANAFGFLESIYLTVDNVSQGYLYCNGSDIRCNDRFYSLVNTADGELLLSIEAPSIIYVSSGNVSAGIVLNHRDMHVLSGGVANSTTVNSSTEQVVFNGGVANDTVVSEGSVVVSGGTTNNASLEFYGSMNVTNGGVANNTSLGMCATLNIEDSAVANGVFTMDQGARINVSGGTANSAYVDFYSEMYVVDGGVANIASIGNGATAVVSSGGVVNHAHVDYFGCIDVYSSGVANDTTLDMGSLMRVYGGTANNTDILDSSEMNVSGGVVNSTTVYGDGFLTIDSGAVANDTEVLYTGDLAQYTSGNMVVLRGGVANNTTVMNGSLTVSSGGEVRGKLDIVTVYDDGEMAVPYDVNSYVRFETGARVVFDLENHTPADTPLITNWSRIEGGTGAYYYLTASADQECGTYILADNASDFNKSISVTIDNAGLGNMYNGSSFRYNGKFYSLAKTAAGELQFMITAPDIIYVSNGQTSSGIILTDKDMHVLSGGIASNTEVNVDTELVVSSGGVANGTDLSSNANMVIMGGSANDTTIGMCATLNVTSSGVANGVSTVDQGGQVNVVSGTVNDLTLDSYSNANVSLNGVVNNASVSTGATLQVGNRGTVNNVTVSDQGILSLSDGAANNTTVGAGGSMYGNGYVRDVVVESGGSLQLASFSHLIGTVDISEDAFVSLGDIVSVSFDLQGREPGDDPLINNWSLIENASTACYDVIVSSNQAAGIYKLAGNAEDFNLSITLDGAGSGMPSLDLDDPIIHNGKEYTLLIDSSDTLVLAVAPCSDKDVYVRLNLLGASVTRNIYIIGDDVTLEDDVVGGTIYGGIGSKKPEEKSISISGCTSKRFYAAGDFSSSVEQTGESELILVEIDGSSFSGGLFMGANAVNSSIIADVELYADAASSKLIMGGSNIGKQFDGETYSVNNLTVEGNVYMSLTDCNATSFCCGGSLLANECQEDRIGNTEIIIVGGTYDAVAGGSLFQSKATANSYSNISGDISISISGDASIQTLYGGSAAIYVGPTRSEFIDGNISITLDVSEGAQVVNSLYVGGAGFCTVSGTGSLTVVGAGENDVLSTKNLVGASTYAAGDDRRIDDTFLRFENFSGTVGSRISFFTEFSIEGSSSVNFTDYRSDFSCKDWYINADDASQVSVILSGNNLSAGKVHNIDFNNSNLEFYHDFGDEDEWTIFKVMDDNEDFQTLCNFGDAQSFLLNDEEIEWDDDELCGISESENFKIEYRFDENENCGMLVAFCV